jgi:hypothetical protein
MILSTFLNLRFCALIILVMFALLNSIIFSLSYVQSANMSISKVISYNSSTGQSTPFPLTNQESHILTPKLSKVISYNSSRTAYENTQSYVATTTNGNTSIVLNGNTTTSQQFNNLIVPRTSSILKGVIR